MGDALQNKLPFQIAVIFAHKAKLLAAML